MALPYRRQDLAKFIRFHDITDEQVADRLGIEPGEVKNLKFGARYPNPDELRVLFDLFGMPVEVLFETELLRYREATEWPPRGSGFSGPRRPIQPYPQITVSRRAGDL
jgi:transcriptional regulator with XRE-family HTH domain